MEHSQRSRNRRDASARLLHKTDRYNTYELVSTFRPTLTDIRAVQRELGYDPRGYGDPMYMVFEHRPQHGRIITTWKSGSSCE